MGTGQRVLVAEDEEGIRALMRVLLAGDDYQTVCVNNGAEALKLIETDPVGFDLVITDVVMPKMNGPELIQEVQAIRPAQRFLVMSGTRREDLDPAPPERLPFLSKPFGARTLLNAVYDALK